MVLGVVLLLIASLAGPASAQSPHETCRLDTWNEVLTPRPARSGLGLLVGPGADLGLGLRDAVAHSVLARSDPAATGFFYGQGAGLGSVVGAVVSAGGSVLAAPVTATGDVLDALPLVGRPLADPLYALARGVDGYATGVGTRADVYRRRRQGRLFSIPADDLMSTARGLLANALGLVEGATGSVGGLLRLSPRRVGLGVADLGMALVPRHARFAGPGHGNPGPGGAPPFFNAIDLFSRCHDIGYTGADFRTQPPLDCALIGDLGRSVWYGPQPGPVGQVYRALEATVFAIKAPVQGALVRVIYGGRP